MPFLVIFKELRYQNCIFRGIFASIWIKKCNFAKSICICHSVTNSKGRAFGYWRWSEQCKTLHNTKASSMLCFWLIETWETSLHVKNIVGDGCYGYAITSPECAEGNFIAFMHTFSGVNIPERRNFSARSHARANLRASISERADESACAFYFVGNKPNTNCSFLALTT